MSQQKPPPTTLNDLLSQIESINLEGFKGKLIIHIDAVHIELHLSGSEPLESDESGGDNSHIITE